jgi:DNA-binding transcriptional LysR family regulator
MDVRDLGYFITIAETGHLGRAADILGRTQPALTKCIQRLESATRSELFIRTARGLDLTPVGEVLLVRARRLRSAMDEALREVTDFARGTIGHVRIGAGATMAEYLLPKVCSSLIASAPGVTTEILIGMSDVLRQALRAGTIDVLVGPILAGEEQEFATTIFGADEVVVVAPRNHPLCDRRVTIEDVAQYKWVLPGEAVAMRQWLERLFQANGLLGPQVQIEANSILFLPRLIAETSLLSYTSTRNLRPDRVGSHLQRLDIDVTTMRRHLGLAYRKDNYMSPAGMRFIELLTAMGESLLDQII